MRRITLWTLTVTGVAMLGACKPRTENDSQVMAAGGGGSDCGYFERMVAKSQGEAIGEYRKTLFLLESARSSATPIAEQNRAKLLLAMRGKGVGADAIFAECACDASPENEQAFVEKNVDVLKMTAALSSHIAEIKKLGGVEAATEAAVSMGQMSVRFGVEGQADLALAMNNEIQKAVAEVGGLSVPDVLTAGVALEIEEMANSGDQAATQKVANYAKSLFSAQDSINGGQFKSIANNAEAQKAANELGRLGAPERFAEVQKLARENRVMEEVARVHKAFSSPENTARLVKAAQKAPRVRAMRAKAIK